MKRSESSSQELNVMPFHMREDTKLPGRLLKNSRSQWSLQIIILHMILILVMMVPLKATQSRIIPSTYHKAFLHGCNDSLRDYHFLNPSTMHFLSMT
jgi:hypothetical protein